MTPNLRRTFMVTLVVAVLVLGAFMAGKASRPVKTTMVDHAVIVNLAAVAKSNSTKLINSCDRMAPHASLGLRAPTLVMREGGAVAVLFSDQTKYTLCVLSGSNNASVNQPTVVTRKWNPVYELESSGYMSKLKGRSLYATNRWFVVRVSSLISSLKVVTYGTSDVTPIRDGFALVHESGKVDAGAKDFSYGEVIGFSAGGALVGSASLN